MFIHLHHLGHQDRAVGVFSIDRAVASTQSDRPLTLSFTVERFIVISLRLSHLFHPDLCYGNHPTMEFVSNMAGKPIQLLRNAPIPNNSPGLLYHNTAIGSIIASPSNCPRISASSCGPRFHGRCGTLRTAKPWIAAPLLGGGRKQGTDGELHGKGPNKYPRLRRCISQESLL